MKIKDNTFLNWCIVVRIWISKMMTVWKSQDIIMRIGCINFFIKPLLFPLFLDLFLLIALAISLTIKFYSNNFSIRYSFALLTTATRVGYCPALWSLEWMFPNIKDRGQILAWPIALYFKIRLGFRISNRVEKYQLHTYRLANGGTVMHTNNHSSMIR